MSTNFYWLPIEGTGKLPTGDQVPPGERDSYDMSPIIHIGLRSGAGMYCWDCKRSLSKHSQEEMFYVREPQWHDRCPNCGANKRTEYDAEAGPDEESHGTEEGIGGRTFPLRKRGVGTCCAFTWAQDPQRVYAICAAFEDIKVVEDEYHHPYTGKEFLQVLALCPIQLKDSIGKEFC